MYGVASYTTQAFGGSGTVFKLDTAGVFTVLYAFNNLGEDIHPVGRLIRDTNGNIHGVTLDCGLAHCAGTVYRLDASGQEEVMHSFLRGDNGYLPLAGVIDAGGTLYGTTHFGGNGLGVVFRINQTGQYDAVHRFAGATAGDGEDSESGGLTLGSDGSIYGTTRHGGTGVCTNGSFPGCGVIFKYTP